MTYCQVQIVPVFRIHITEFRFISPVDKGIKHMLIYSRQRIKGAYAPATCYEFSMVIEFETAAWSRSGDPQIKGGCSAAASLRILFETVGLAPATLHKWILGYCSHNFWAKMLLFTRYIAHFVAEKESQLNRWREEFTKTTY